MSGPGPDVTVVMATHNRARRLGEMLDSLRAQTLGRDRFEVIVVDDASTDETVELLERARTRGDLDLSIIRRDQSSGPATARNQGWQEARAPLVAFTDDDCVAGPRWLEAALSVWREHPTAIVQGRTDPRPDEFHRMSPFTHTVEVHVAGPSYETCNIFYPRELLERLGGFDEESFSMPGGEDTDLAWKAIDVGRETFFADDAQVYHAVTNLGPIGKLKLATRWHETMLCFARHPELKRQHMVKRVFWKWSHYTLFRAALAILLPRRLWPLRWWLAAPYVEYLTKRRTGPLLAPWVILHDLVEIFAVLRGAVRYRVFVL
jgi:glycosyltransferase involved in cell wall biosynthesis